MAVTGPPGRARRSSASTSGPRPASCTAWAAPAASTPIDPAPARRRCRPPWRPTRPTRPTRSRRWPGPTSASTSTRSPTGCASSATPTRTCASTRHRRGHHRHARWPTTPGDRNAGRNPRVVDVAYTNNVAGATTTTLLGPRGLDPESTARRSCPTGPRSPALTARAAGRRRRAPRRPTPGCSSRSARSAGRREASGLRHRAERHASIPAVRAELPERDAPLYNVVRPEPRRPASTPPSATSATARPRSGTSPCCRACSSAPPGTPSPRRRQRHDHRHPHRGGPIGHRHGRLRRHQRHGRGRAPTSRRPRGPSTFAPGETSKTITVPIPDDADGRGGRVLRGHALQQPDRRRRALGSPSTASVRINANDRARPTPAAGHARCW